MNIIVCGDSHSRVFSYCNKHQEPFIFNVCEVGGATAQGAVNPNSKTNALGIFSTKLKNTPKADKVLIMLGEVDCGFVIWVRSKRYNISVDEQLQTSIDNLFQFIETKVKSYGYVSDDIIIAGVILPTIKDNTNKKYLNGVRSEVDVDQYTRTQKTLEYNQMLKTRCNDYGYHYIDITDNIVGEDGLVQDQYLSENHTDHHLSSANTYQFWINHLERLGITYKQE
jgi:hypothetical protein